MKHTLLTGLLLASLSVLVLHAADAPKAAPNRSAGLFPDFNWDRVPVNIHFGKRDQMTDAELDFIASHSEFVAMKSHGVDVHGSTERGIAETAHQLKQRNPRLRVLFYFNSFVNWPGFTWMDQEVKEGTRQEKLRLVRERITFPLACFLIGAQPGCHFCYSWGYREADGGLDSYPEFQRPLGQPQANAVWSGLTATREFAHASVWINLSTKQARIDWK